MIENSPSNEQQQTTNLKHLDIHMLNICSSVETLKHPNAQMFKHSIK
jgi:hypothetical protein